MTFTVYNTSLHKLKIKQITKAVHKDYIRDVLFCFLLIWHIRNFGGTANIIKLYEILSSLGSDYEEHSLVGCDTV
jgi:hypothetical protein